MIAIRFRKEGRASGSSSPQCSPIPAVTRLAETGMASRGASTGI
jgi:hypothetical protein